VSPQASIVIHSKLMHLTINFSTTELSHYYHLAAGDWLNWQTLNNLNNSHHLIYIARIWRTFCCLWPTQNRRWSDNSKWSMSFGWVKLKHMT